MRLGDLDDLKVHISELQCKDEERWCGMTNKEVDSELTYKVIDVLKFVHSPKLTTEQRMWCLSKISSLFSKELAIELDYKFKGEEE